MLCVYNSTHAHELDNSQFTRVAESISVNHSPADKAAHNENQLIMLILFI